MPKLSIVTVNLNNAAGLLGTLKSIRGQTLPDVEHIIVDGGSTDGSVEIIKDHSDGIAFWVSERDAGIYNAMNKGIRQATGEYCLFLNSGDSLLENTALQQVFDLEPIEDILYFNVRMPARIIKYPSVLNLSFLYMHTICHQAMLTKTSLFRKIGLYNEQMRIAADWEFLVKAIVLNGCSYRHFDRYVTLFDESGVSSNAKSLESLLEERRNVLLRYFPMMCDDYDELWKLRSEVAFYRNSRAVRFLKRVMESEFYRRIRRPWERGPRADQSLRQ